MERYIVDTHGPDVEAVKIGVAWLVTTAERLGKTKAAVVLPGLQQVEPFANALGIAGNVLAKQRRFRVDGQEVEILVERQMPISYPAGPVLAVWPPTRMLDRVDDMGEPALCVISWNRSELEEWKRNWNPVDLRTGAPAAADAAVTNPVVEAALRSLTNMVNLGTGLTHPSDKAAAVQMFKVLKKARESYEPAEIMAWAVQHGWESRHARELKELGQKILDGRAVRAGKQTIWRDDIVEIWRQNALPDQ